MKKALEYFKVNKKIFIIAALLIILIVLAFFLFGSKNKSLQVSGDSVVKSESEIKLTRILSEIDGVGQTEVMISESADGINGIIIVCEGANSLMTRNDVINAVTTAFIINKNNIAIYAMNK